MDLRWIVVCFLWASSASAELNSVFAQAAVRSQAVQSNGSLFGGAQTGMFAPLPERVTQAAARAPNVAPDGPPLFSDGRFYGGTGNAPVDRLLALIAQAEAGPAGYDAVQHGARIRPSKRPTDMTLGEIYAWVNATPGQPHAIGRYQFIPDTLRRVARIRGFGPEVKFTEGVQDALALVLLEDAGLSRFQQGAMAQRQFMHNLARIWAGLPLPNGRSYYQGYAGNAATMTWAAFEGGMQDIWGG